MSQNKLSLDTLGELHLGLARLVIDKEINLAVADLDDRGEDEKARKVVIELTLKRRPDGQVEVDVGAQAKLPARRTASTVCRVMKTKGDQPALLFQEFSPENPDQLGLPYQEKDQA